MNDLIAHIKALTAAAWTIIVQWFHAVWTAITSWWNPVRHIGGKLWSKRDVIGREFKHKQRFVIMDSQTYKEKWSFQLSAINLFVTIGIGIIALVGITIVLIAFTPLREFIPGYANAQLVEQTYQNALVIDSIENNLAQQERMMADLKDIMMGRDPGERATLNDSLSRASAKADAATQNKSDYSHSDADSALRKEIESQDRYAVRGKSKKTKKHSNTLSTTTAEAAPTNTTTLLLFTPTKGKVISPYNAKTKHYGVDIAGAINETVKSVAAGTVIFSNFTTETGYVIAIQHQGGMISLYKHNNALLKHEGDVVRAGEPIAFLGNSGELTSGPHLHFELWVNGKPVNPLVYISF